MTPACARCGGRIPQDRILAGKAVRSPAAYCGPSCKAQAHNERVTAARKAARAAERD